jgi:hypothetical protein
MWYTACLVFDYLFNDKATPQIIFTIALLSEFYKYLRINKYYDSPKRTSCNIADVQ